MADTIYSRIKTITDERKKDCDQVLCQIIFKPKAWQKYRDEVQAATGALLTSAPSICGASVIIEEVSYDNRYDSGITLTFKEDIIA